jgi:hypothetical protein
MADPVQALGTDQWGEWFAIWLDQQTVVLQGKRGNFQTTPNSCTCGVLNCQHQRLVRQALQMQAPSRPPATDDIEIEHATIDLQTGSGDFSATCWEIVRLLDGVIAEIEALR